MFNGRLDSLAKMLIKRNLVYDNFVDSDRQINFYNWPWSFFFCYNFHTCKYLIISLFSIWTEAAYWNSVFGHNENDFIALAISLEILKIFEIGYSCSEIFKYINF